MIAGDDQHVRVQAPNLGQLGIEPFDHLDLGGEIAVFARTVGILVVQTQGANIRAYSDYLLERVRGYRDTKTDYVRVGAGKLKKLSVDKGLLRETEAVQNQIGALVKCDVRGRKGCMKAGTLTSHR